MEKEEINKIISRYINNQATENDKILLESWYLQLNEDLPLQISIADRITYINEVKEALDHKFAPSAHKDPEFTELKLKQNNWSYIIAVAAVIICIMGILLYPTKRIEPQQDPVLVKHDSISTGGNKPFLVLSNGERINLTAVNPGAVAVENGIKITKIREGELIYKNNITGKNTEQYNTIEIPNGGVYQLQLADGTKVWLNAASTLRYPTTFSSLKERKVELSGEAYFEVAKNRRLPFRVVTRNQVVDVLGTHFNINSYREEGAVKTTLLEGRISINKHTILKSGEQAVNSDAGIKVIAVDAESAVDWKNGKFSFNQGQDFQSAMYQIERWYDVKFVYLFVPDIEPRGRLPRNTTLKALLNEIEEMGKVHFKIEGRRIIVTQ